MIIDVSIIINTMKGLFIMKKKCLGNIHFVFGISLFPYEYLTRFHSENVRNNTVYELATIFTSETFRQEKFNILENYYNSKNPDEN